MSAICWANLASTRAPSSFTSRVSAAGWIEPARCRSGVRSAAGGLAYTFDDPNVAIGAVVERFERGLVARTVVRLDGLVEAVELDHNDALHHPPFIDLGWPAADQKPPAGGLNPGPTQLPVAAKPRFLVDPPSTL